MLSIFILAILTICSNFKLSLNSSLTSSFSKTLKGALANFLTFNSFLTKAATEGVPTEISISLVLGSILTVTGISIPLNSFVFSFILLITSWILTFAAANCGPNGGAGFAFPPSTIAFISVIFLHFFLQTQ